MITRFTVLKPDVLEFPSVEQALSEPNGLLALGGDLSVKRLVTAYSLGIFPWFNKGEPILWWSPNPRTVLFPKEVHCSRSMQKLLRKNILSVSINHAFDQVIQQCAAKKARRPETWIHPEMIEAYRRLHQLGYAHSIEIWQEEVLIGGLYGIALSPLFFGESMFSLAPNGSKVALLALCGHLNRHQYRLIDCQVENSHVLSMGARCIPREEFLSFFKGLALNPDRTSWQSGFVPCHRLCVSS